MPRARRTPAPGRRGTKCFRKPSRSGSIDPSHQGGVPVISRPVSGKIVQRKNVPQNAPMRLVSPVLNVTLLLVGACGDSAKPADAPLPVADASLQPDSLPEDLPDAPITTVNDCATFVDKTGSTMVEITFPTDQFPVRYQDSCVRVKIGTTVTWSGALQFHPLRRGTPTPQQGVDSPGNPIPDNVNTGSTAMATFTGTG